MTVSPPPWLPYGRQSIDQDDIDAVSQALKAAMITGGDSVPGFEHALADKVQARFAVSCSSGTAALHLAVAAAGLKPGDRAVVPSVTFVATANACRYAGADVAFSDVDEETGNLTAEAVRQAAAGCEAGVVKAVLPVHLNGHPLDGAEISKAAKDIGAVVIEDACQALGADGLDENGDAYPIGACRNSDMTVFSFHPLKSITTGEGGAVTTNSEALYERLCLLRNHGLNRTPGTFLHSERSWDGEENPWYYELAEPGFNYRLSDINAALGLSQLAKLDGFITRRTALAQRYDRHLEAFPGLITPVRPNASVRSAYHLYAVRIDFGKAGIDKATLVHRLKEKNIGTQVHFIPVHRQPYYEELYGPNALPGADGYYQSVLSLPLFPAMDDGDVDRVAGTLGDILSDG